MGQSKQFRERLRTLVRKLDVLERNEASCSSISLAQCHTLVEIGRAKQIAVNELAGLLNVDKSTVSRSVDHLVRQGFVLRAISPNDRRSITLSLTAEGQERFQSIEKGMESYTADIIQLIPKEKCEQVIESLDYIINALKKVKMNGSDYRIRTAVEADFPVIKKLLSENDLTTAGVEEQLSNFLVADSGEVIGLIGLEFAANAVMLRSMVINHELRNYGIATALVNRSLEIARQAGIEEAYLLTNTAEKFAARWGFYKVERSQIPEELMKSSALHRFCPASSVCMKLDL